MRISYWSSDVCSSDLSCLAATKSISRVIAGNRAAWRPCWTEAPRLRRRWRFAGELLEAIGVRLAIERDQGGATLAPECRVIALELGAVGGPHPRQAVCLLRCLQSHKFALVANGEFEAIAVIAQRRRLRRGGARRRG